MKKIFKLKRTYFVLMLMILSVFVASLFITTDSNQEATFVPYTNYYNSDKYVITSASAPNDENVVDINELYTISGSTVTANSNYATLAANKTITISSVTGNIVITVAATKQTEYMYYGRLSISEVGGKVIQYSAINENMVKTGANMTKAVASTLGKTSLGLSTDTAVGDYVTIAVPSSKGYTVTRDNGIGGKVTFDEDTAGANGIDITIDSIPYKLYGMILLDQAEIFIYID